MPDKAMAFYHTDGLVPTWKLAQRYIERGGRLATLPDIIDARLASKPGEAPWENYFTTLSAEYFGIGRDGRKIIIVAHGVGPMATLDGVMAAYKHEYGDKSRDKRGGRISAEEFRKLEAGEYGEVFTVGFNDYVGRYEYPFMGYLRFSEAATDPLLAARLGGEERAREYLEHHLACARQWHAEQAGIDPEDRYGLAEADSAAHVQFLNRRRRTHWLDRTNPYIVEVGDASNAAYKHMPLEEDMATAHLLSVSRLMSVHHERHESLAFDIHCHEWTNGCRLVGVPAGVQVKSIHPGWDPWRQMANHWRELMTPAAGSGLTGLHPLMKFGDSWFTMYPAAGHSTATGEPEFMVESMEQLGEPVEFITEIHGYYGFFRYDVRDLQGIAPPQANGFVMGEPELSGDNHHRALVTFYRITGDTSRRLRRRKDIENDYDTQMRLLSVV